MVEDKYDFQYRCFWTTEGKIPHGILKHGWKPSIKMNVKEVGYKGGE